MVAIMDIKGKTIWQVGTGTGKHDYSNIFLKYDVMAAGPGHLGEFKEDTYKNINKSQFGSLRRFCLKAQKGDIVLMRHGTGEIHAVGIIVDRKGRINKEFEDVDGYWIQHTRRVRWFPNLTRNLRKQRFGAQGRTFSKVNDPSLKHWVQRLHIPKSSQNRALNRLRKAKELDLLEEKELYRRLSQRGFSQERINGINVAMRKIKKIVNMPGLYDNKEKYPRPSEEESIHYLVLPFLKALGWSVEQAAVQWNNIDIALFKRLPSRDSNLACVVEVKSLGSHIIPVIEQAKYYVADKKRETCRRIITTDGIRYAYFTKQKESFKLKAYLNIEHLRKQCYLYDCGGAVEAIVGMACTKK